MKLFTEKIYSKPFIIVTVIMFTQQFSGIHAVMFNLQPIMLKAGSELDAGISSFIIAMVQVVITVVSVFCVDRFGRKPLLLFSGICSCLSITCLGIFFYLDENKMCVFDNELPTPLVVLQENTTNLPLDKLCSQNSTIDPKIVENISWLPLASLTGRDFSKLQLN